MSSRTVAILLLVFAVLIAVAIFQTRRGAGTPEAGLAVGNPLWPGLEVNRAAEVEVSTASSTVRLARKEERWVVSTLYGYPADFARLARMLRELADAKAADVIREGEAYAKDYGMDAESPVVRVAIRDSQGNAMARAALGAVKAPGDEEGFVRFPLGRYVRPDDGPIVLVEGSLEYSARSEDWIERELLNVPAREIESVSVTVSNESYTLRVVGAGQYELEPIREGEQLDIGAASRLAGALQYLRCESVADPAAGSEKVGFQEPSVARFKTRDGFEYTAQVSETPAPDGQRYLRLQVAYHPPPEPTREQVAADFPEEPPAEGPEATNEPAAKAEKAPKREEKIEQEFARRMEEYQKQRVEQERRAEELRARLSGWTFVVRDYVTEALTMPREKLVRAKEPEKKPEESQAGAESGPESAAPAKERTES